MFGLEPGLFFICRTDNSPDTTTKELSPLLHTSPYGLMADANAQGAIYQPSFLAYSAGEVPTTTRYVQLNYGLVQYSDHGDVSHL